MEQRKSQQKKVIGINTHTHSQFENDKPTYAQWANFYTGLRGDNPQ